MVVGGGGLNRDTTPTWITQSEQVQFSIMKNLETKNGKLLQQFMK